MKPTTIALAVLAVVAPANAQQQSTFTNSKGEFAGSTITRDNKTTFQDARGHFTGSSITRGDTTTVYDRNGHYLGTIKTDNKRK
jgi:hypothetical protein